MWKRTILGVASGKEGLKDCRSRHQIVKDLKPYGAFILRNIQFNQMKLSEPRDFWGPMPACCRCQK